MEIKSIVDQVSKEKDIKKDVVVEAVKKALIKVMTKQYPYGRLEAQYDEKTGQVEMFHFKRVVDSEPEMLDEESEVNFPDAKKLDPDVELDDELGFPISSDFGRIDASKAKQVILEEINRAVNEVSYNQFLPFKGKMVSGTVQRADFGGVLVNLGKTEAFIPKGELNPREQLKRGMAVEALLVDITLDKGRTNILLSRKAPELVVAAFTEQVPEIEDGTITVVDCVREAGVKTKMVVDTQERYNPVAVCIGTAGYRIQKVQHQIGGERVDVVAYTRNEEEFLKSLLGAKRIYKFSSTDQEVYCEVEKEELPRVVGLKGANIKLASRALKKKIKVAEKGSTEVVDSDTATSEVVPTN
jgi:N utilization substance protein A